MGDWKTEIQEHLTDIRASHNVGADILREVKTGGLVALSTSHALPAHYLAQLPINQQNWARAYATGLSVRKAIVTGRAAAYLQDMWVINSRLDRVDLIAKYAPPRSQWPQGVRYSQCALQAGEVVAGKYMRVTDPVRTLLQIARYEGFVDALVAADGLLQSGYARHALEQRLADFGRVPGIAVARRAVALAVYNADSPPESHARALLLEAGYKDVRANVWVVARKIRVDVLIDGVVVVEVDGRMKYGGTFGDAGDVVVAEKRRADRLQNLGFVVVRFSPGDLVRAPAAFLSTVASALSRAG